MWTDKQVGKSVEVECNNSSTRQLVNSSLIYHLLAFLVVAIWGSTFVVTKLLLLAGLSPAMIFTLRFIIAYALLLGFAAFRRPFRWFANNWKDELIMLGLGLTGGSL